MQHIEFGRTGLRIPRIVFGTTSLGNLFRAPSDDVKRRIVAEWFERVPAPVCIDSAGKYGAGMALEVLGRELAALGVDASDVVISNKLGWRRVPLRGSRPSFEPDAWIDLKHDAVQDISYEGILRCWEEGCELLGGYRPALVSVHDPDDYLQAAESPAERERRWQDILGAYRALEELRDRGEVQGVGVGAKDWTSVRDLADECELDWVMLANSLTVMRHPPELLTFIEQLSQRDVGIINAAVFHAGFLTGGEYFDYRLVSPDAPADRGLFEWRDRFHSLCEEFGISPATACVAYGLSRAGVDAVALSSSVPERVADNVALVDSVVPDDFWTAMRDRGLLTGDAAR